jgi:hypothetical protein
MYFRQPGSFHPPLYSNRLGGGVFRKGGRYDSTAPETGVENPIRFIAVFGIVRVSIRLGTGRDGIVARAVSVAIVIDVPGRGIGR